MFLDDGDWVTPGSEDSSEVGGGSMEVVRMVTDVKPSRGEVVSDVAFG